jgi:glycosyltransferase 2 family protein
VKLRIVIIAILGLALALYLLLHAGFGAVLSAAAQVGWSGFAILCLYALGQCLILGAAWSVLLARSSWRDLRIFVGARMVRDAVSDVLPFSQLGGIVLGARAAVLGGISQPLVFASTIVDVTTEMLAQIAYIAVGVAIFSARAPRTSFAISLNKGLIIGLLLAVIAAASFLILQRYSKRMTARIAGRMFPAAVAAAAAVSAALDAIYRSPLRVGASVALHAAGWIAGAIGAWIAFDLIGVHIGFASVLAIESLICAIRSIAVLIPNALGVQEGAYAVLSPLFGVAPEFGLALSLLKRARDVAIGVPILLVWQALEGRRAVRAAKIPQGAGSANSNRTEPGTTA